MTAGKQKDWNQIISDLETMAAKQAECFEKERYDEIRDICKSINKVLKGISPKMDQIDKDQANRIAKVLEVHRTLEKRIGERMKGISAGISKIATGKKTLKAYKNEDLNKFL